MQSKQSETENNYTPYEDLYSLTPQNKDINSNEPPKDEESPESKKTLETKKPKRNCVGIYLVVFILFLSWPIINQFKKESSENDRFSTGIDFSAIIIIIFYLAGLTFLVTGIKLLILKEEKKKKCYILIGTGIVWFLFVMLFDFLIPVYDAIVVDNKNNFIFLNNKIFVPIDRKKTVKLEEIESVELVIDKNEHKFGNYAIKVKVIKTNNKKFTGATFWDEKNTKNKLYEFLSNYLGGKVHKPTNIDYF